MAKKGYVGIDNIARKIKKSYVGINNIARKIKKAYIGIGGVARPCLGAGEVEYYGQITPLSVVRGAVAAQTIGNYALFAGGYYTAYDSYGEELLCYPQNTVDTYNQSLTRGASSLSTGTYGMKTTTSGNYALFIGGFTQYSNNACGHVYTRIEGYSSDLVHVGVPATIMYMPVCATTGSNAIFMGGYYPGGSEWSYTVQSLSSSLVMTNLPDIASKTREGVGATINGCALLSGSYYVGDGETRTCLYCYNSSLTRTQLDTIGYMDGAVSTPNHAIFYHSASNMLGGNYTYAFDKSLTKTQVLSLLNEPKTGAATASLGGYALIGGGANNSGASNTVLILDEKLTVCPPKALSSARNGLSATAIGNYALFGGGALSATAISEYAQASNVVDAFVI